MSERREPVISNLKSDEVTPNSRKTAGQASSRQPKQPRASQHYARPPEKKSAMAGIAFFFALMGVALAGFSYWQLMEANKIIAAADLRIQNLESKFELSDDESTASVTALQAKVKWADSEIRKLWGVAYDTNRKNITTNETAIKSIKNSVASLEKVSKDGRSQLTSIEADIKLVNDLVDAQQSSLSSIEKQSKAAASAAQIAKKSSDELKSRVDSNEESVQSFDAFRRTVNQRLLQGSTTP